MFIFVASPKFSDFVEDEDVHAYLDVLRSMGTSDESINSSLSIVLFNLLRGVYELGDITRIEGSNFNILFCMHLTEDSYLLNLSALEACFTKLADFSTNVISPVITLLLPNFDEEGDLDNFTEEFAELYRNSEIERSLAVMTTSFVKDQLGYKVGH